MNLLNTDINHMVVMLSVVVKGVSFSGIIRFPASYKNKEWKSKLRLDYTYTVVTQCHDWNQRMWFIYNLTFWNGNIIRIMIFKLHIFISIFVLTIYILCYLWIFSLEFTDFPKKKTTVQKAEDLNYSRCFEIAHLWMILVCLGLI